MITVDEGIEHVITIFDELESRMDANEYQELLCTIAEHLGSRIKRIAEDHEI